MNVEQYVVVRWPECQFFMEDRSKIILVANERAYEEFGDSSYWVEMNYYEEMGFRLSDDELIFLKVPFPQSNLFQGYVEGVYPIDHEEGIQQHGLDAFMVEQRLFEAVKMKPSLPFLEP